MRELKNKISKTDISKMEKVVFPGRVFVIYTQEAAIKAVDYLNMQSCVGVDTETRPSFKKGTMYKVSLLQISTLDTCFLFRLNLIGMPKELEEFLIGDVLKIGLSLKDDFNSLKKRKSVKTDLGNWIELQDYAPKFGIEDKSLQKLFANLFGQKISKSQRLSNWEAESLSDGQQLYAATDAWACVKIYNMLQELEKSGDYVTVQNELINTNIDGLQKNIS